VPWRVLHQETDKINAAGQVVLSGLGTNNEGDWFGGRLLAADLDQNGVTDLAVAAYRDVPAAGEPASGAVYYFAGHRLVAGDARVGLQPWFQVSQVTALTGDDNEAGDDFGYAMAAGDFDADGKIELAIGAPGEDGDKGAVYMVMAHTYGAWPIGDQIIRLGSADSPQAHDLFGYSLAPGVLDNTTGVDLAIGAPGRKVDGIEDAGQVYMYRKNGTTLSRWGSPIDATNVLPAPWFFGMALDVGNVDGAGVEEIVASRGGSELTHVFRGTGSAMPTLWKSIAAGGSPSIGHVNSATGPEDIVIGNEIFTGSSTGPTLWKTLGDGSLGSAFHQSVSLIADFDAVNGNDVVCSQSTYHTDSQTYSGVAMRYVREGSNIVPEQVLHQEITGP
jgi:hypothetical protein